MVKQESILSQDGGSSPTSPLVLTCPYCGAEAHLQDSAMIYGKSFGMVYLCDTYPFCDSWVGVHKGTTKPLGTMADTPLRELRKQAHTLFDRLWKKPKLNRKMSKERYDEMIKSLRTKAYSFLSNRLGIPLDQCHIAMMNIEQCQRVISLFEDCQISMFDE